jgi:hypothetical protein
MVQLSDDLISFLENYFFPAYQGYSETLCSDAVKNRIGGSDAVDEEPLIKEKIRDRTVDDYTTSQRNEYIRVAMTQRLFLASAELNLPGIRMEVVLRNISELSAVAKKIIETLPSAKGRHGDPSLNKLIAEAQIIYRNTSGEGFYSKNGRRFISLLIEYVADFARRHIGADHAHSIETDTKEHYMLGKIRKASAKSTQT